MVKKGLKNPMKTLKKSKALKCKFFSRLKAQPEHLYSITLSLSALIYSIKTDQ